MRTEAEFFGDDGARHRIGFLPLGDGGGYRLVDAWEGHGLRLLAEFARGDLGLEASVDCLLAQYRPAASSSTRPLSCEVHAHQEFVTPILSDGVTHGTARAYRIGCRCEECREAKARAKAAYRSRLAPA